MKLQWAVAMGLLICAAQTARCQDVSADFTPPGLERPPAASPLTSYFIAPTRIVWQSDTGVTDAENLLQPKTGQVVLDASPSLTVLQSSSQQTAGILLDFGIEVQGYVELFTSRMDDQATVRRVRVRFGESVAEAMADLSGDTNDNNDHALHDQTVLLPSLGTKMIGPGGFRFVRIDNVDQDVAVELSQVRAVLQLRDIPYVGSFRCNDERLNRIWQVGAYTVHLNMQEYLWDGIKRDRLVRLGEMHPEVSTINAVFGFNDVVPRSLDLIRDVTPATEWMSGISTHSMWWVIIQEDWWMHHGNQTYLEAQQDYMTQLLKHLATFVAEDGNEQLDGTRFLDWPTSEDPRAVDEGLQAMMIMTMESGARLMTALEDQETAELCRLTADKLRQYQPEVSGRKSPSAFLALAGLRNPRSIAESILKPDGPRDLSTFYGFYVLQALAKSDDHQTALDFINTYWGAMLDLGATTFWEDFDLAWVDNAAPIDQVVPEDKRDVHGDFGSHSQVGYRRSLCHGRASGPTAWLSQHVLGVTPLEPGCRRVRVVPYLGQLKWVEGQYPTPLGPLVIRHERQEDQSIRSTVEAPEGMEIVHE